MFIKIYNLMSQFLRKDEKPNSRVMPVDYDYDYARLYELV